MTIPYVWEPETIYRVQFSIDLEHQYCLYKVLKDISQWLSEDSGDKYHAPREHYFLGMEIVRDSELDDYIELIMSPTLKE